MGGSFPGGIFHGEREFFMKGAPIFSALLKKRSEIKLKNRLFQPKVRSNIKT